MQVVLNKNDFQMHTYVLDSILAYQIRVITKYSSFYSSNSNYTKRKKDNFFIMSNRVLSIFTGHSHLRTEQLLHIPAKMILMNENELYWPGMFTHTRNLL